MQATVNKLKGNWATISLSPIKIQGKGMVVGTFIIYLLHHFDQT